jgi:tyrosine aminotransferase
MYIMVGVDTAKFKDLGDDKEFSQKLITEQSVFCLPASVFKAPNFFRIVTTVPTVSLLCLDGMIGLFGALHPSPLCLGSFLGENADGARAHCRVLPSARSLRT